VSLLSLPAVARLLGDLPTPQTDPDEVRRKAHEILSRPEYREPPKSLLDRINNWVEDLISRLFNGIGVGSGGLSTLVAYLVLLALAGLLAWLVVWAVQSGAFSGGRGSRQEGDPVIVDTDAYRSAKDWLAEAARHEAEGRWAEGLLCRYRALVVELVEREVIAELVGRTAGEYVHDVRQRDPARAPAFAAATELFERAWYGGAPSGPEERDRFAVLAAQVLEARPATVGAS
jgi:hypothetical protein